MYAFTGVNVLVEPRVQHGVSSNAILFFEARSLIEQSLLIQIHYMVGKSQEPSCLYWALGLQVCAATLAFYMNTGDPKSGPCASWQARYKWGQSLQSLILI